VAGRRGILLPVTHHSKYTYLGVPRGTLWAGFSLKVIVLLLAI